MQVETPAPQLKFGVHLSGTGDPAAEANLAESLGFDAVAVDRDVLNGLPAGLEMWTTLTWVAARTSTVTVVPNMLALPNRHPALLARMAETLDRLSAGRVVLALGARAPALTALRASRVCLGCWRSARLRAKSKKTAGLTEMPADQQSGFGGQQTPTARR